MEIAKIGFTVYLFLSVYCVGSMTVLQLQHFALYPKVGKESFKEYIKANNSAAVLPAILPAIILLASTLLLIFVRPSYMSNTTAILSLVLNLVNIISTAIWQGRLHSHLANSGYNELLIHQLISTNWIRTIALFTQSVLAIKCATSALP